MLRRSGADRHPRGEDRRRVRLRLTTAIPDWRRLAVIAGVGTLAVVGTSVLAPMASANTAANSPAPSGVSNAHQSDPRAISPPLGLNSTQSSSAPFAHPGDSSQQTPASPAPSPAPAPAPTPSVSQAHETLPPDNPPANIAPQPDFLQTCSGAHYDDSAACVDASVAAITNGRKSEGLAPLTLPGDWTTLTPQEQMFVATNLERTTRGLPPLSAMVTPLDNASQQGAAQNDDPAPPSDFGYEQWGSNWAGAVGNPLEAMYLWMYDDGPGSSNVDCTARDPSGCWGHRDNVLLRLPCQDCVMGTGYVASAYQGTPSWTEMLVEANAPSQVDYTWEPQ